ncbi:hypothetical protein os1_21730 [Comamonadaceae bacterium OS-1]|nr:hypothetical protein os1_21730 [Comamonadaceae bacterium OS-1]
MSSTSTIPFLPAVSRGLTLRSAAIAQVRGQPVLVPLKLQGEEGVNQLFEYRLLVQTTEAIAFMGNDASNLQAADFIGRELTCTIELEGYGSYLPDTAPGAQGNAGLANLGAGTREISGLITHFAFLAETERHAHYQITLRPWLHLATLNSDCKVFQDQTPIQTIEAILADYPFASDKRLIEDYPVRDYSVQYNESDFAFITRLMQEWGINYHFEHSAGVHRLVWSDYNGAYQSAQPEDDDSAYRHIPYYPPGHKIDREYIHAFAITQRLTSQRYASREYDYTRPKARLDSGETTPGNTSNNASNSNNNNNNNNSNSNSNSNNSAPPSAAEIYLWRSTQAQHGLASTDYSQPNAGADKAAHHTEAQGQHLARLRAQALHQHSLRAHGSGHVRGITPGTTFTLQEHPQTQANTEYLVLGTQLRIEISGETSRRNANSPASTNQPTPLASYSDAAHHSAAWQVEVHFQAQPSTEILRPDATQAKPPIPGLETAVVCGPSDDTAASNIYTDHLGRIKIQFPWDRYGPRNHTSSCWVRVASGWAGNQLGLQHIPRIGQEVLIGFLGGDIDQPLCTGQVRNQDNHPNWQLPDQQALTGLRSRELKPAAGNSAGGRSNHLALDDTAGQIQVQLKSDHAHSSLSLGYIRRIEDHQGRKDPRGEGFELRSDRHGSLRAQDGLLLSTQGRPGAQAHTTDMGETVQRLDQGQAQHASLADLAQQHQAQDGDDQTPVAQALQAQNQEIAGTTSTSTGANASASTGTGTGKDASASQPASFPEFSAPHLVLASPAGIESTTSASTHQHSGEHHAITSGGHTSISAGKSLLASVKGGIKLFAYKLGIKLVSANQDIEIQALKTSVHLLAKLEISHTANSINLTAKERIVINGGGSYTEWSAGGITSGTSGAHTVHSASLALVGPKTMPVVISNPQGPYQVQYILQNEKDGAVLSNHPYSLQLASGKTVAGMTNDRGETMQLYSAQAEDAILKSAIPPKRKEEPWHLAGGGSPALHADYL